MDSKNLDQNCEKCQVEQAMLLDSILKVHEGPHAHDLGYLVLSRMPSKGKWVFRGNPRFTQVKL